MRSQHFELSTNEKPRFLPDSRGLPNMESANRMPMCKLTVNCLVLPLLCHLNATVDYLSWSGIRVIWANEEPMLELFTNNLKLTPTWLLLYPNLT